MANDKPLCITGQSINGASSAEVQQISHAKKPILVSQSTEVVALTAEEARLVRAYRGMSGSNRIFIYDLAINDAIEAGTKAYSGIHIRVIRRACHESCLEWSHVLPKSAPAHRFVWWLEVQHEPSPPATAISEPQQIDARRIKSVVPVSIARSARVGDVGGTVQV